MTECGQYLYENGEIESICIIECGTEHSHDDYTATEAISAGAARLLDFTDTEGTR